MKHNNRNGFTLIELLVVISIIAVILGLTSANMLGARGRARDAKAKAEMKELKNALRLYYNDYQSYPVTGAPFDGCGESGTGACPNTGGTCPEFSAWPVGEDCTDTNTSVYMKRLPRKADGVTVSFSYAQTNSGDDFCLATPLENSADSEIAISQSRCSAYCGAVCTENNYCMCAD